MTRKVKIIDEETGQVLRETFTNSPPLLAGFFSPADILKIATAGMAVIVFFVNGQNDKKIMQENLASLGVTVSRLTDFKENSDSFQTQVYGTRFRNGEPLDMNFKLPNKGNFNGS